MCVFIYIMDQLINSTILRFLYFYVIKVLFSGYSQNLKIITNINIHYDTNRFNFNHLLIFEMTKFNL